MKKSGRRLGKKYYNPVKISERFTIVPTWEDYTPVSSDEVIIELDPGMAFGTGTHPTTVMCIQALERTVTPGDLVVDVGTGSGVLSIAAALLMQSESSHLIWMKWQYSQPSKTLN